MNAQEDAASPYQANDDPPASWRAAIDGIAWVATSNEGVVLWYRKRGACPHCEHEDGINASVEAEGWLGLGPEDDSDIFVSCQCAADHTGRPAGVVTGCGWRGYVAGPVPDGRA